MARAEPARATTPPLLAAGPTALLVTPPPASLLPCGACTPKQQEHRTTRRKGAMPRSREQAPPRQSQRRERTHTHDNIDEQNHNTQTPHTGRSLHPRHAAAPIQRGTTAVNTHSRQYWHLEHAAGAAFPANQGAGKANAVSSAHALLCYFRPALKPPASASSPPAPLRRTCLPGALVTRSTISLTAAPPLARCATNRKKDSKPPRQRRWDL